MKKKDAFTIITYGCEMNTADSEQFAQALQSSGWEQTESVEKADVVIINTCSVRQAAEDKAYGLGQVLKNLKIENWDLEIILTGCMVGSTRKPRKRYDEKMLKKRMPWVDYFFTHEELQNYIKKIEKCSGSPRGCLQKQGRQNHAQIPVTRGCDQFCTYCVVPYGRGKLSSRPQKEIVEEIKLLAEQGINHITLLGQSVNNYGLDFKKSPPKAPCRSSGRGQPLAETINTGDYPFVELLTAIHKIPGISKISLLSPNPWNFPDELIEVLAMPKFERYIHLPVQSGDNKILKKMNRPYTVEEYKQIVKKIREKIPEVKIGTDIIVGFPKETKKQFQNTVDLVKEIGFEVIFVAKYSEREGTTAAKTYEDSIPLEEKRRRHKIILDLAKQKKENI